MRFFVLGKRICVETFNICNKCRSVLTNYARMVYLIRGYCIIVHGMRFEPTVRLRIEKREIQKGK